MITKWQRRFQGLIIFVLTILLILGSMLIALTEQRYSNTKSVQISPVHRYAAPPPNPSPTSGIGEGPFRLQQISLNHLIESLPAYED